ncbi:MAG: OsmC family protein [Giesbergeria sp.]|uniref:OsmC family protein n=1 Tax=Giesbergeria sp. TaxID=2818473 RepID=UPI00260F4967|nr:OsmC family protein [Giesbergeria sp.]MDD2608498.1 OsmC family protein [Giesbergeria sp.]
MSEQAKLTFSVQARRVDSHSSQAECKAATLLLDTDLAGRLDAFNPAELLLAALAACIIKGIERVTPILKFDLRGVEVRLQGVRQDVPPKMESIRYEIFIDTDESDQRLHLLHENVKKYGTVFNTLTPGTCLGGILCRGPTLTNQLNAALRQPEGRA